MLRKDELEQLTTMIDTVVSKRLQTALEPIYSDLRIIKSDISVLKIRVNAIEIKIDLIEKQTADIPSLKRRVEKIENHLGLRQTN